MKPSNDVLETSYAYCRQICRRAGSSFHAGFRLLPEEKRRGMEALYAFMRYTDDLADNVVPALPVGEDFIQPILQSLISTTDLRPDMLVMWREDLQIALEGGDDLPPLSLLPALADTVHRFQIPHKHLMEVIDGVEMDLVPRRYETFDELERYCEFVASAVGMACIHIWGFCGPEAFEPARKVGVAMQLTNILRDLKEDAQSGRIYLPQQDMRECGYSADDLSAGVVNEPFFRLMRLEIERAEQFYREGIELLDLLKPVGRRIFGLMTATYRALLRKIAHDPAAVLQGRVRLGLPKRLRLAARWALLPPRKAALQ